MYSVYVNPGVT